MYLQRFTFEDIVHVLITRTKPCSRGLKALAWAASFVVIATLLSNFSSHCVNLSEPIHPRWPSIEDYERHRRPYLICLYLVLLPSYPLVNGATAIQILLKPSKKS